MRSRDCSRVQPSTWALSSNSSGTSWKYPIINQMIIGRFIDAWSRIRPKRVSTRRKLLKIKNRGIAVTTGGNMRRDRIQKPKSLRPLDRERASPKPAGTPIARAKRVEPAAVMKLLAKPGDRCRAKLVLKLSVDICDG